MRASSKSFPAPDMSVDELDHEIEESLRDPEYRAAYEDGTHRECVLDALVSLRKKRGLTQKEVARRMGVGQPTVSGFENEGSDPRLSTLQRYARAIEVRVGVSIHEPVACDWVKPAAKYEFVTSARTTRVDFSDPSAQMTSWAQRTSFALGA